MSLHPLQLSRNLRKQRLAQEQASNPSAGPATRPDLYYDFAPCGRYPIIALRTVPCNRYIKGQCLPCSYSARPYAKGLPREELHASLMTQLEWVLSNFDEVVAEHATGRLDGYRLQETRPGRPWYTFQLAGESSFFRDEEIPPGYRRKILQRLADFQHERDINLHLMLECRPEDLVAADQTGELEELTPLFRTLNIVVNMGLEYFDDWLRNELFSKDLELNTFETAAAIAHQHQLDPGVFIFAGAPLLTPGEILRETQRTLDYATRLGVFANLMVPNLQEGTVPNLLWDRGLYELPEPFFLLDLADLALEYRPARPDPITPFPWFIGGLESDPPPRYTILDQPRRKTSDALTEEIHKTVLDLVKTLDTVSYRQRADRLRRSPEARTWQTELGRTDDRPWPVRLKQMLDEIAITVTIPATGKTMSHPPHAS